MFEVCHLSLQMRPAAGGSFSQRLGHKGRGRDVSAALPSDAVLIFTAGSNTQEGILNAG